MLGKEPSPITGRGDTGLSREQAQAVATQLTALTGLEPLDETLSLSRPTYSCYLPRENAAQFVDLLLSISTSIGSTLALDLAPQSAVTDWTSRLMKRKGELAQVSARRTPSPAVSSWSFTTSTVAPPSEDVSKEGSDSEGAGEVTTTLQAPDDAGTRLLVVILVDYMP